MNKKYYYLLGIIIFFGIGAIYSSIRPYQIQHQSATISSGSFALGMKGSAPSQEPALTADSFGISQPTASRDATEGSGVANIMRPPSPAPVAPGVPGATEKLIVKTGQLSLVVKDVPQTIALLTTLTEQAGGFVVESNLYKNGDIPTGYVTVRLPVKLFDQGVGDIKKLGEVVSESLRGTDVTAEFVDLESQLRNYRATEDQLLAILKRAGSISDILEVQNQLTNIRGQIESIQGRMKYLQQTADFSSLTINLSTDPSTLPIIQKDGEQWKPLATFKAAVQSLILLGQALVDFLIWFGTYSPIWIGILLIGWWLKKKYWSTMLRK
jgi:hypothetical protein